MHINTYTEFTHKQTEIYRAKLFEYISRNMCEAKDIEQRWQTDMEIFIQRAIYFDGIYESYLANLEIGDLDKTYELLNYIIEFKVKNPIPHE